MSNDNFIDYVKINFRSGNGGAGATSFYRDKLTSKGGPDGGDGGRGGHIILRGNRNFWTLLSLKYRKHIFAENGVNGGKQNKTGKSGKDIIVDVPLGTIAYDENADKMLEILNHAEEKILLEGGKGGLGNWHFKSASNQNPEYHQKGLEGLDQWIVLELKVLADVGLVGLPNAGKSTLVSKLTAAKPKIADYPFTTLTPNLGIVQLSNYRSFVIADIPGIIEGAHQGKGLGHRFLRHIERNSVLLYVIPSDSEDIITELNILENELNKFSTELALKDKLLVISKSDFLDDELKLWLTNQLNTINIPWLFVSSFTKENLESLKEELWKIIQ